MRLDWVLVHPFVVLGTWQYPASPTNFSATFRGPRKTNREARFPRSPGRKGPPPYQLLEILARMPFLPKGTPQPGGSKFARGSRVADWQITW